MVRALGSAQIFGGNIHIFDQQGPFICRVDNTAANDALGKVHGHLLIFELDSFPTLQRTAVNVEFGVDPGFVRGRDEGLAIHRINQAGNGMQFDRLVTEIFNIIEDTGTSLLPFLRVLVFVIQPLVGKIFNLAGGFGV